MSNQSSNFKLADLIIQTLEGVSGDEDYGADLEKMLLADPEALEYYADFLMIHANLRKPHRMPENLVTFILFPE